MTPFRILVKSPSNIALVKYMGKLPGGGNLPANPSISMTLSGLATFLELRVTPAPTFSRRWVSEAPSGGKGDSPKLDRAGEEKFLAHFDRCVSRLPNLLPNEFMTRTGTVEIRSSNTFPHAAGIASSASSFSALTLACAGWLAKDPEAFKCKFKSDPELRTSLAQLSREGSGSSCRSFDGPYVAWEGEQVKVLQTKLPPLSDLVVVISSGTKKVGSSEAHARVASSPHWSGRVERAGARFKSLTHTIELGDFKSLSEIADADFRDMHQLFETAEPPFSYFSEGTSRVLDFLDEAASESKIAVTLDAGPNVHVLVPQAEEAHWKRTLSLQFPEYPILVDREGKGAEIL